MKTAIMNYLNTMFEVIIFITAPFSAAASIIKALSGGTEKAHVNLRVADLWTEERTRYFQNTNQEH
jgi:hypothetical protein